MNSAPARTTPGGPLVATAQREPARVLLPAPDYRRHLDNPTLLPEIMVAAIRTIVLFGPLPSHWEVREHPSKTPRVLMPADYLDRDALEDELEANLAGVLTTLRVQEARAAVPPLEMDRAGLDRNRAALARLQPAQPGQLPADEHGIPGGVL